METKIEKFEDINYVIRYPNGYEEGKKYPVILMLHGSGTRGTDPKMLLKNAAFTVTERCFEDFPFVMVAPQCHTNTWFDIFESLKRFAVMIAEESYTDRERLYLMGVSMGGYGAWQLAMSLPELFAAIVPICGGGMYWNAARLVNVPVWAFHGGRDTTVFPEESRKMVDSVNRHGGSAKLTIFPENGHNAWDDTFSSKEVFDWLLSNKNSNTKPIEDIYKDSLIYG
ncbi:MAG: phospholipase [Ruminococcaceae bacterium]|nr:phospholipase [Oscillospiraceae bacterium]